MKIKANEVTPRTGSIYPEPFKSMMSGRYKRALGDLFGITKFGVNMTTIEPGGMSALLHRHSKSQEFVFILKGTATVYTETEKIILNEGECIGFMPNGPAHHLKNESNADVVYIEIGDREPGDSAVYPNDDIVASKDQNEKWMFHHKDGTPY